MSRVPGPELHRAASRSPPAALARAQKAAGEPHRRAARRREPAHRHLRRRWCPRSCRSTSCTRSASRRSSTAWWTASTRAPRRSCASSAASRPTARGATRRWRPRVRPLGGVQARPGGGGRRVLGDRRARAARPHGQGHPHRAARRDDLAQQQPGDARHRVRRAPRARHHGRDARPAGGLRAARHGAARLRLGLHRQLLRGAWWAWRCSCCSWTDGPDAPRPRPPEPMPPPLARARPGAAAARAGLRAADRGGQRARAWRRSATASSTWRSRSAWTSSRRVFPLLFVGTALVYMLLAVPAGRLADRVGRGRVFVGGYALLAVRLRRAPAARRRAGGPSRWRSVCSACTTPPRTAC